MLDTIHKRHTMSFSKSMQSLTKSNKFISCHKLSDRSLKKKSCVPSNSHTKLNSLLSVFGEEKRIFAIVYYTIHTCESIRSRKSQRFKQKKIKNQQSVMFDDKHQVFRDECARSMSVLDSYYEPLLKQNRGHLISGLIFCVSVCAFQLLAAVRNISLFATFKLDSPTKQNVDILS